MFDQQQKEAIQKMIDDTLRKQGRQRLHQSDVPPGTIKRRHIEDIVIVFGLAADRPTSDETGIKAYFSTDDGVLALWDGTQWLETTLT